MTITKIQDLFELNDIDIAELKNGEHSYVFKIKVPSDVDLVQAHSLVQSMKELCERCGFLYFFTFSIWLLKIVPK